MVCGSCIAAAAVAGAGTFGFFRLVDMVRDGGLRRTVRFLRGERDGRHRPDPDDEGPAGEEHEALSGSRS